MVKKLKESFQKIRSLEPFFTIGLIRTDTSGQYLLCSTGDSVKVLLISDGCEKLSISDKTNSDDALIDFVSGHHDGVNKLFAACRSGLLKEWDWDESSFTLKRVWKSLHYGPIISIAISKNGFGDLVATGGSDSIIKIWNSSKQYCTHHLKGCRGIVSFLSYQSDKSEKEFLVGAGELDNVVYVWDLDSSKVTARFEGHSSKVVGVFFLNDEQNRVITGSRDMIAIVWSFTDSSALRKIPIFEAIETMLLLPIDVQLECCERQFNQNHIFMTGGPKGIVKVWDVNTGNCVFTQKNSILENSKDKNEAELILQFLLHPNKKELILTTFERNILFYSLDDFTLKKQLIGHIDQIYDLKFLGVEEMHIVVGSNSPLLKIFELSSFNCSVVRGHTDSVLALQVFPSNPNWFVSSSKDNDIRVWEFFPDTMSTSCLYIASGHSMSVTSLAVPSKSHKHFYSASEDTTLKVWQIPKKRKQEDFATLEALSTLETIKAHDKEINGIVLSPNDKFLCSCSQDKSSKLWSVDGNLSLIAILKGHKRGVWSAAFSPVDLVVATSSVDATIKIWSLSDFSCLKTFQGHECSVLNISFMNQGMQLISSASDGNVKLWTAKTGECSLTIDAHSDKIWPLSMNRDESLLVTGSEDSKIIVWKDDTQEKIHEKQEQEEKFILKEQKLSNLMKAQKWTKALKLAIKLDNPNRALNIIKEILLTEQSNRPEVIEESLRGLREDQMYNLAEYTLKWNTNTKNSEAAQLVFCALLNLLEPEKFLKMPNSKEFIEGWLSYTQRHVNRVNRLKEQASIVNFLYASMRLE